MKSIRVVVLAAMLSSMLWGSVWANSRVVPDSEFNINGLRITEKLSNVQAIYGQPTETKVITNVSPEGHKTQEKVLSYGSGLHITTDYLGKYVWNVTITDPKFSTPKGIHVGSSKKDVVRTYGDPHGVFPKGDTMYYAYYNIKSMPQGYGANARLYIGIKDNKVVSMELTHDDLDFAALPLYGSKMYALNNIRLSYGMDYVRSIYGEPTSHRTHTFLTPYKTYITDDIYTYGDSVEIRSRRGTLLSITVTANNGWTAPGGIAVGMSVEELITKYGFPAQTPKPYKGHLYYSYGYANLYLLFEIKNGRIVEITLDTGGD